MKNNRTRIDKLGESRMNIDRLKQNIIKLAGIILVIAAVSGIAGCGKSTASTEKVFYYGDTTFNAENDETDVNPHNGYSGWACIRYGVGETLFKYSDTMELEPWLAESYENVDELTWKINLKDGITFTSGRKLDGEAVKECIEHLVAVHKRAAGDLNIERVEAEADTVIITTAKPVPALINYLSDPYGCIIDMQAGITDEGNVSATGPYIAEEIVTDSGLTLVKNQNYWNGEPRLDKIIVKTISDGDTLTMALQSGELNAAYGLPYSSLSLFNNSNYTISSSETSRSFFAQMNYANVNLQDSNVRAAIAMAINKKDFTNVLLKGNGTLAEGPFPKDYIFGDSYVKAAEYNIDNARNLLAQSGWKDTDGDGYVDKNGYEIIPLKYDEAGNFSDGLAKVRIGGKYGKYSPILDKIEIEDARYGYINNLGIERIPILYSHANDFSEGLAAVCMHNKWGFINRTGNVVVPLKYDCVHDFKSGFAQVFYNGKKLGINMRGEEFDIKFIELVRRLNLKGTPDDVD